MSSRKPLRKRKNLVDFLDLGSGKFADRSFELAARRSNRPMNKRGRFVSVDKGRALLADKRNHVLNQPHHTFKQQDIFEYLQKCKPASVKIVNDEYLGDELLVHAMTGYLSAEQKRAPSFENEQTRTTVRKYIERIHRVLIPRGRFFVVITEVWAPMFVSELQKNGFSILSVRKLSKEEIKQKGSEATKLMVNLPKIQQAPIRFGIQPESGTSAWPVRISASKKPGK